MFPTLEQQVVKLNLSQELKKYGLPQKGLWWWVDGRIKQSKEPEIEWDCGPGMMNFNANCRSDCSKCKQGVKITHKVFVAPTSAEIGYWLPQSIGIEATTYGFRISKMPDGTWDILYDSKYRNIRIPAYILCNALAKMLLHGLKNKLWKFEGENLIVL